MPVGRPGARVHAPPHLVTVSPLPSFLLRVLAHGSERGAVTRWRRWCSSCAWQSAPASDPRVSPLSRALASHHLGALCVHRHKVVPSQLLRRLPSWAAGLVHTPQRGGGAAGVIDMPEALPLLSCCPQELLA